VTTRAEAIEREIVIRDAAFDVAENKDGALDRVVFRVDNTNERTRAWQKKHGYHISPICEETAIYVDADELHDDMRAFYGEHGTTAQKDELRAVAEWNATQGARWDSTLEPGDGCCTPSMGLICARRFYAGFEADDIRKAGCY
jgi:hypothetical protein